MAELAARRGVLRLTHLSQMLVDEDAEIPEHRAKFRAEQAIRQSGSLTQSSNPRTSWRRCPDTSGAKWPWSWRALVREGGRHTVGETKTRRGRRQVNITPRTVNILKAHRKRQLEVRMRLSGIYEDHGLIFATGIGTPVNPENLVKRSFKPLLKRAGLPEIRFHDLRHTCATLLLGRGVHPKIVQELLGHATIAMTLDTYSHYIPSMGEQASGAMGDALG